MHGKLLTFDRIMLLPRTPNAEHRSYSLLHARSVASRTRHVHTANRTLGAPLYRPSRKMRREGREAIPRSRHEDTRASVLFSCTRPFFHNCTCARPWSGSSGSLCTTSRCAWPHSFCARGETACIRTRTRRRPCTLQVYVYARPVERDRCDVMMDVHSEIWFIMLG